MKNLLAGLLLIFGLTARAQTFTPIHNYQQPDGLSVYKYFGVPYGPTPILNVTRTVPGAVFYNTTDSSLYSWTGVQWLRATGGVVISPSPGVDSITISGNVICQWRAGVSTCYALDRFFTDVAISADRLRFIYYNFMGDSLKTVDIPHTIAEQGAGMILTRRGDTINFATSGTGGTVPKFTPMAVPFATADSTLGEDEPGLNYNGTNLAVGHNNPNVPSGITVNGSRGLVLADIGGLYISAGGNGTIGVPDPTKHILLQNNGNSLVNIYADGNTMAGLHTNIKTDVLIDSLKTTGTAPVSAGTDRMVTTDINGKLSFAAIPTPGGSVSLTAGLGLSASPSTITGSGSFALDSASAVVLSRARAAATYQPLIDGTGFVKSTAGTITYDNSTYQTSNQAVTVTATGDATGTSSASGTAPSIPLVLATVNSNVGSFTNANVTVNAKGLVTAVSNGSGGGATPDSSWVNAEFGNTPNAIGLLYSTNWSTGAIPTGWATRPTLGNLTTSYTGGKLTVTGGNFWGFPSAANAPWSAGIQFNTKRMPYEKLDFVTRVVPLTKAAGNIVAVTHAWNGFAQKNIKTIIWDLSNGVNSGRTGLGTDSTVTFATNNDSTSKMSFSVGDSLFLYYKEDTWSVTAGIYNKTTGVKTRSVFPGVWRDQGGEFNLIFIKGQYVVTNTTFSTWEEKGKTLVLGASYESGTGATSASKRWQNLVFGNNPKHFLSVGLPSASAKYVASSLIMQELLADAQPSKVINALSAYNDESEGFGAPATKVAVDSILQPAIRSVGASNVFLLNEPPRGTVSNVYNDSANAIGAFDNVTVFDINTALKNGGTREYTPYFQDGVHTNDSGYAKIAQVVLAKAGDRILSSIVADSSRVVSLYGIPNAREPYTPNLVGVESDGKVVSVPNYLPNPNAFLQNLYSSNTNHYVGIPDTYIQANTISGVNVSKVDSAFMMTVNPNRTSLLQIGFNNLSGVDKGNIEITDASTGSGQQKFGRFTGTAAGNIIISASSPNRTKGSTTGDISSNNNLLIGGRTANTLTGAANTTLNSWYFQGGSATFNVGVGPFALYPVSSGNFNVEIVSGSTTNGLTLDRSNTVIIGSNDGETVPFKSNSVYLLGGTSSVGDTVYLHRTTTNGRLINTTIRGSAASGSDQQAGDIVFQTGTSAGVNLPGKFSIANSTPLGASSATLQNSYTKQFQSELTGITIGNAATLVKAPDAIVDMQSTTKVLVLPRMTQAQRDLIPTGLLTFTGLTNGTGYTNGTVQIVPSGGTCSVTPVVTVFIQSNVVNPATIQIVERGACSVAPTTWTVTSGGGTGATFSATYGATVGGSVFCTDCTATDGSIGVEQTWVQSLVWKNKW